MELRKDTYLTVGSGLKINAYYDVLFIDFELNDVPEHRTSIYISLTRLEKVKL